MQTRGSTGLTQPKSGQNARHSDRRQLTSTLFGWCGTNFAFNLGCRGFNIAIISIMTPESNTDDLDARLEEEGIAMTELRSNVAENKEASKELEKSLDELEAATQKLADKEE